MKTVLMLLLFVTSAVGQTQSTVNVNQNVLDEIAHPVAPQIDPYWQALKVVQFRMLMMLQQQQSPSQYEPAVGTKPATATLGNQTYGYEWNRLPLYYKRGYLMGYLSGKSEGATGQMAGCFGIWNFVPSIKAQFTYEQWKTICFPQWDSAALNIPNEQLTTGMDSFYTDYRNANIDYSSAIRYVQEAIEGKSSSELEADLLKMRKIAAGDLSAIAPASSPAKPTTAPAKAPDDSTPAAKPQ